VVAPPTVRKRGPTRSNRLLPPQEQYVLKNGLNPDRAQRLYSYPDPPTSVSG